jgi:hypothetical protein
MQDPLASKRQEVLVGTLEALVRGQRMRKPGRRGRRKHG